VHTVAVADRGALVICTDGLWNYLPEADDIARLCADKDAMTAAHALVDFALSEGGIDNITVAIIPIGGRA
jgi:serine/threonine protein phosphatase PrpC